MNRQQRLEKCAEYVNTVCTNQQAVMVDPTTVKITQRASTLNYPRIVDPIGIFQVIDAYGLVGTIKVDRDNIPCIMVY